MNKGTTTLGFTLVETLVAVTILTLAVVGPMTTANRVMVAAQTARDQLTASYLAQEGIEHVRALRDNYFLADVIGGWGEFVNDAEFNCAAPKVCTVDPLRPLGFGSAASVESATEGDAPPLNLTSEGRYTQQDGTAETVFTRTVQVSSFGNNDERVVSEVSWTYRGTTYRVRASTHLTPWQ